VYVVSALKGEDGIEKMVQQVHSWRADVDEIITGSIGALKTTSPTISVINTEHLEKILRSN